MKPAPQTISLALVSHTNVGKTTLARTLLAQDVGEVRDAPHVTEFADEHLLVEAAGGDRLLLWDTPGFGDSARLLRLVQRLQSSGQPIGWMLSQVWDRVADRAFWSSQQALRAVRDHADVVLYLVNAAERPAGAGYVGPEMEMLRWLGKPVLVLLNQMGAPRPAADEAAEVERWRAHLAPMGLVRDVLPMDAFARCWVQERTLLLAVRQSLKGPEAARMGRLLAAWQRRRTVQFDAAMASLAASLARCAAARQPLADSSKLRDSVRRLARAVRLARSEDPATLAQQALAAQLDELVRASTAELIALHGLSGSAGSEVLARVTAHYDTRLPLDEGKAALLGGTLTGALAGLKADVLSGGMTLGGGLLAGGLLGALGGAGAARAVNLVRGVGRGWVGWSDEALDAMCDAALLRYLAVAHFGRGRGDWAAGESPPHWRAVVAEALAPQRQALRAAWGRLRAEAGGTLAIDAAATALQPPLAAAARAVLHGLYPAAADNPAP